MTVTAIRCVSLPGGLYVHLIMSESNDGQSMASQERGLVPKIIPDQFAVANLPKAVTQAVSKVKMREYRQQMRMLALDIGIHPAARACGLKESRVLNWAVRYGWNKKHRCPHCGQPVVKIG